VSRSEVGRCPYDLPGDNSGADRNRRTPNGASSITTIAPNGMSCVRRATLSWLLSESAELALASSKPNRTTAVTSNGPAHIGTSGVLAVGKQARRRAARATPRTGVSGQSVSLSLATGVDIREHGRR
jgi:hypothetical protein